MVNSTEKEGCYIFTIKPETKEEKEMLEILLKMDKDRQKEIDYWTVKKKPKDIDEGFRTLTDEEFQNLPFSFD